MIVKYINHINFKKIVCKKKISAMKDQEKKINEKFR